MFLQVQRNCCLTLCNFSIPEELEFQYSRVNQLLLKILEPARQDESIQRIAVHLCNALVCQVDNHHKEAVGKMGFVKVRRPHGHQPHSAGGAHGSKWITCAKPEILQPVLFSRPCST